MTAAPPHDSGRLIAGGIFAALVLHAALVLAFVFKPGSTTDFQRQPTYTKMVITQAGPVSVGVVAPEPTPEVSTPAPRAAEHLPPPTTVAEKPVKKPKAEPKLATVTPNAVKSSAAAPVAGAGDVGGKGADLANVDLGGTEFPYPGYQRNIITSIAAQFHPTAKGLRAEVMFIIRRDGSVDLDQMQLLTRSGNSSFDNAAMAAIEAVANKKQFGPLPTGFANDALTVIFKFDPSKIPF